MAQQKARGRCHTSLKGIIGPASDSVKEFCLRPSRKLSNTTDRNAVGRWHSAALAAALATNDHGGPTPIVPVAGSLREFVNGSRVNIRAAW